MNPGRKQTRRGRRGRRGGKWAAASPGRRGASWNATWVNECRRTGTLREYARGIPKTKMRCAGGSSVGFREGGPRTHPEGRSTPWRHDGSKGGPRHSVGASGGGRRVDVGGRNLVEAQKPLGSVGTMGVGSASANVCRNSCVVRAGHRRETAGTAAIRKGAVRDLPAPWSGKPTAPQPGKRAEGKRGGRSAFASSSHVKGAAVGLGEKSNGTFEARGAGVLEVGFPVGRSARADVGAFRSGGGRGSDRGLGDVAKTPESKPVRAVPLGGLAGGSGRGDRKLVSGAGSFRSADGCHHRAVGRVVAGDSGNAGFYGPLDKTRRRRGFDASDGRGKAHRRVPGITTVEARRRRNQHLCNNDQVFVGFRGHRPSAANVEGHHPAVVAEDVDDEGEAMEAVARLSPCTTHSIIRRGKRTRLPSTAEERSSPLHVSGVETMDVDGLRSRMTDVARERFDQVWNLTFYPEVGKLSRSSSTSSFAGRHAAELLRNGIARAASGPGRAVNVPFTVVEEKPEGLRQRFILWTRDANGWAEEAYEAHVPLFHISKYLDRVLTEVGSTRDFKTGFYAIEIPEEARDLFRFKTTEGEWFELCRLPMGHVCAPELMHSLAAAAAGDPAYVRRQWAARDVGVDVFIDNIRYTGTEGAVLAATVNLDAAAADFRLTWKPSDSNTAVSKYTFLGVDFDHEASSVMPSAKIRRKLAAVDLSSVTASQLESMAGRLMHASAIAAASPGKYWYALKFLRRLSNGLNRGVRQVHDVVSVPVSVAMELRSWSAAAVTGRVVAREPAEDEFTTFVDASLRGWGGVVVNDRTAEVTVLGDAWGPSEQSLHINVLEGMAFRNTVSGMPVCCDGKRMTIWIDNTSVIGVARKKMSVRSQRLNDAVVQAIDVLADRKVSFCIAYVKSALNPADLPSRVDPGVIGSSEHQREVELAVRAFLTRDVVVV